MTELFQESGNDLTLFEDTEIQSKFVSHNYIIQSKKYMLLINCKTQITLRELWYIVQVNLESSSESSPNSKENDIYYCMFLSKHPDDQVKSNEFSRWWPEWNTYTNLK